MIISTISTELDNYLQEKESRSIRNLERISKVSKSYISRLLKKEISEDSLDVFKVLPVLKTVCGHKKAIEIVCSDPTLKEKYTTVTGGHALDVIKVNYTNELAHILSDRNMGIVVILASNACGTTTDQIKEILGQSGIIAAEKLQQEGIVTINENGFIKVHSDLADDETVLSFTRETYKALIPHWLSFYKPHNAGKEHNFICGVTEGVSEGFLNRAFYKIKKLRSWIDDSLEQESNKGNNPFFFTAVMDTFTESVEEDKGRLN